MPNGTYGGVRGRKTKVGRKLSFSSYSIIDRQATPRGLDLGVAGRESLLS